LEDIHVVISFVSLSGNIIWPQRLFAKTGATSGRNACLQRLAQHLAATPVCKDWRIIWPQRLFAKTGAKSVATPGRKI
jgi:hypothetical protein